MVSKTYKLFLQLTRSDFAVRILHSLEGDSKSILGLALADQKYYCDTVTIAKSTIEILLLLPLLSR